MLPSADITVPRVLPPTLRPTRAVQWGNAVIFLALAAVLGAVPGTARA